MMTEAADRAPPEWVEAVRVFYRAPAVRERIAEYCGAAPARPESSCWGLAGYGGARRLTEVDGGPVPCAKADLDRLFAEGADVCRSLADLSGTLLQVDVDYVDPEDPGAAYRAPEVVLERLAPVRSALVAILGAYGIVPRVVLTGRGYHFTVRALRGGPLQGDLVQIGELGESMKGKLARSGLPPADALLMARGHEGAGRVLEHVAHLALHRLRGCTAVPVSLVDAPPPGGGPFVCLDLTAYADPLFERYSRCAFSTNQKSGLQAAAPEHPFVVTLPCRSDDAAELLPLREDGAAAASWAATAPTAIPDVSAAPGFIEDYRRGPVGRFHEEFYRGPKIGRGQWRFTYDRLTEEPLPGCLSQPLDHPNPLLLRPACLRTVALGLWGLGWHPRSIAGIVASRFEQEHGFSPSFDRYDATTRAQFYVRVLCGALADGLDDPASFDCDTQEALGLCEPWRCDEAGRVLLAAAARALERKGKS